MIPYIDNEYGQLKAVLLSEPIINKDGGVFPNVRSLFQYSMLLNALRSRGIKCVFIGGSLDLPYQCYTRDSSIITPFGLYINNMGFSEREKETELIKEFAIANGWPIAHEAKQGTLEGGDVIIIRTGLVIIGTNRLRTSLSGAGEIREFFEQKGWIALVVTYDAALRHLDVAIGVIDEATVVYAAGKISEIEIERIMAQGVKCVPLDVSNAAFACNFVNLGGRVLLTSILCDTTRAKFKALCCTTVEIDISEFILDDGGPHCLIQCIVRNDLKDYR